MPRRVEFLRFSGPSFAIWIAALAFAMTSWIVVRFAIAADTAPSATTQATPATSPNQSKLLPLPLGSERRFWFASVFEFQGKGKGRQTVIQSRAQFSDQWRMVSQLDSPIVGIANRNDDDVSVLLESGRLMIVWTGGGAVSDDLPAGCRPLALTGNSTSTFALARGPLPPIDLTTQPSTATARPGSTVAVGLFELVNEHWKLRAVVPHTNGELSSSIDTNQVNLGISGGTVIIAVRDRVNTLRLYSYAKQYLSRIGEMSDIVGDFGLITDLPRPMLWTNQGGPAGALRYLDALSSPPKVLAAPNGLLEKDSKALIYAIGSLRLLYFRSDERPIIEQCYTTSGEIQSGQSKIDLLPAMPSDTINEWVTLPLMIALSFFLFNPVRRNDNGVRIVDTQRPDGFEAVSEPASSVIRKVGKNSMIVLAPINLRLWAAVVDALPLLVAFALIAQAIRSDPYADPNQLVYQWRWWGVGATALYFLHTLISELILGRTIGKWMFGLRTVNATGGGAGVLAILLRNVLRMLELSLFIVPLISMTMTRMRQRVGDLAANTLVVIDDSSKLDGNDRTSE